MNELQQMLHESLLCACVKLGTGERGVNSKDKIPDLIELTFYMSRQVVQIQINDIFQIAISTRRKPLICDGTDREGRVLECGHRGLPEGVAFELRFEW